MKTKLYPFHRRPFECSSQDALRSLRALEEPGAVDLECTAACLAVYIFSFIESSCS